MAQAYLVNMSTPVIIILYLSLFLNKDALLTKSADQTLSIYSGIILSLLNFVMTGQKISSDHSYYLASVLVVGSTLCFAETPFTSVVAGIFFCHN